MLDGHLFEHSDERLTDDLALLLRVGHAGEQLEEAIAFLHVHEVDLELAPERLLDLLGFPEAKEPGVDEHAGELVADGAVHERRGDGRVDATRQTAQHPLRADLRADLVDGLFDDAGLGPRRSAVAHVEEERTEHVLPALGVRHLGVELHAVQRPFAILERGDRRAGRGRGDREPFGHRSNGVAVAHPHLLVLGQILQHDRRVAGPCERGAAVLATAGALHVAAELERDELGAVADAEHRDPGVVDGADRSTVRPRRAPTPDRRRR